MKFLFFSFTLLFVFSFSFSQDLRIGEWRSHLNYTEGIKSEEAGNKIYCATKHGLFSVDKDDLSVTKFSKIDGFTDNEIATIKYDPENGMLLIAYQSANIDMVKNGRIYNIPDIYRSSVMGKKAINDIFFYEHKAYLSTSFGIVVYDLQRMEVKETYSEIGLNGTQVEVFSMTIHNGKIYASTKDGVITASLSSPNLLDYNYWSYISGVPTGKIVSFHGKIYAYTNGKISVYDGASWNNYLDSITSVFGCLEVYHNKMIIAYKTALIITDTNGQSVLIAKNSESHVMIDAEGVKWLSVLTYGLVRDDGKNINFISPNGPASVNCWDINFYNSQLYVVPGALTDGWGKMHEMGAVYTLDLYGWINKTNLNDTIYSTFKDIISIAGHPTNGHIFLASFGNGLADYYNGKIVNIYNQHNSSLKLNSGSTDSNLIEVSSVVFDSKENMWVTNWAATNPLSERFKNGAWKAWNIGSNINVGNMIVDDYDQKWILLPIDGGIIVFDETRPAVSNYKKLVTGEGKGNLPSNSVKSIAKDLEGRIWIGTDEGVAVFYDPSLVFTNYNSDAQRVWVDEGDNSGYLLSTEIVTAIAVDGANKKWLGTKNGVWYVTSDGTKIIQHFTSQNSPLPTDVIRDITVDGKSGEVFFATSGGIVSYKSPATEGGDEFGHVYAYPNPVKPGYDGIIAIKGLVRDANVKITDMDGNLVYETTAEGGQAVWDGKNFDKNEVRSGVYLVYSTNSDGTQKNVTKIMIIR